MRASKGKRLASICAGVSFLLVGCATPEAESPVAQPTKLQAAPVEYTKDENWLCRPGHEDNCETDLTTTIVFANGKTKIEKWQADPRAKIDCFYIYPTISADNASNSDLVPAADEEIAVTRQQAARFASVCRLFVPMYRSSTVPAMIGAVPPGDRDLAYGDIKAAWLDYLARDNHGRGVVLMGHSQGGGMVRELVRNEIDAKPVQGLVLSALIIGNAVRVPDGQDLGGDYKSMPVCRSMTQLGCVITYSTFRDSAPPDKTTRFGKPRDGIPAACTNPAALAGGSGALKAYLPVDFNAPPWHTMLNQTPQPPWLTNGKTLTTPYVAVPGLLTGECKRNEFASYLAIAVHGDPKDPRVDDIKGDTRIEGVTQGEWGLHLDDMLLPMGNLIDFVRHQSEAYQASHP